MLKATCLSNMSWYMPMALLSVCSAALASRMLFSIICRNKASTCWATALTACGEFGSRFNAARALMSAYVVAAEASTAVSPSAGRPRVGSVEVTEVEVVISNDDEFGLQGARFAQRLEDGHQIAGSRTHLVHGVHDLIEFHAGLEQEHAIRSLIDLDGRIVEHHRLPQLGERIRLTRGLLLLDGHGQ